MQIQKTLVATTVLALTFAAAACSSDKTDSGAGADRSTTSTAAADADRTTTTGAGNGDPTEDAALPAAWPDEIALPDGTTLLESTETAGGKSMTAVAEVEGDAQAAFDAMVAQLTDADYEIVGSTFTPSDQGGFGSISAKGAEYTVAVAFGPDPTGDTSQMTINLAQVASP